MVGSWVGGLKSQKNTSKLMDVNDLSGAGSRRPRFGSLLVTSGLCVPAQLERSALLGNQIPVSAFLPVLAVKSEMACRDRCSLPFNITACALCHIHQPPNS